MTIVARMLTQDEDGSADVAAGDELSRAGGVIGAR